MIKLEERISYKIKTRKYIHGTLQAAVAKAPKSEVSWPFLAPLVASAPSVATVPQRHAHLIALCDGCFALAIVPKWTVSSNPNFFHISMTYTESNLKSRNRPDDKLITTQNTVLRPREHPDSMPQG